MLRSLKNLTIFCAVLFVLTLGTLLVIGYVKKNELIESVLSGSTLRQKNVLEIYTVEDYLEFSASVSNGNMYKNRYIKLCSDLDFSEYENLAPIGAAEEKKIFYGTFDGDGYKISGMHMERGEDSAGMFAYLGGVVKNLRMEDCTFSGKISGSIAAETNGAGVLNCYIDAESNGEISGAVVGSLRGNIFNCVTKQSEVTGTTGSALVETCYQIGQEDFAALNDNLTHISGFYQDVSFYLWDETREKVFRSEKAELLQHLTAIIGSHGREMKINGYYSANDREWCFALPAGYRDTQLTIKAFSNKGDCQQFQRKKGEEVIAFSWKERLYPVRFLSADNLDTVYVTLEKKKTLTDIHANKYEEVPGVISVLSTEGQISDYVLNGFYGHGNDSWDANKKSYNVKFSEVEDFLGLGENEDFSLLACYRDVSLMNYVTTTGLIKELEFDYAPDFSLVNLYVAGDYVGVYFATEKVELDTNRIDIKNVYNETKALNHNYMDQFEMEEWKDTNTTAERYYYDVTNNPEDLTGGYLLEADIVDYGPDESRFVSERGIPMTMKRARYSSKEQVDYIAEYWQEFEDALFSLDGKNSQGRHYTEYIDVESFAMQWLCYELVQEGSMSSSIYFYKESDITGDGLLHACFPWDMEHSYAMSDRLDVLWNVTEKMETLQGYWTVWYLHEDFKDQIRSVWNEKFIPAIETMIAEEAIETQSGMRNLRWYEERIADLDRLENSRWRKMHPLNRCQVNREFLKIRMEVLSRILFE